MAMIQCPECKQPVSDAAPTCPNCGTPIASRAYAPPTTPPPPPPKKTGCLKIGCIVLAVLVLIGLIGSLVMKSPSGPSSTTTSSSSSTTSGTTAASSTEPAAPQSKWSYNQSKDDMGKGTVSEASVESDNTVNFTFPYQGEQHGTLTLRTHPRWGKNVIFAIRKGQIPCHSFSGGCKALVRFDDGQAVNYAADGPEDNSTETIFLRDYNGFVGRLMKAKKVKISVNVFQQGEPVFEFNVRNFEPDKYKVK
jgi:hypothetical protein